jgi:hypothetical protein
MFGAHMQYLEKWSNLELKTCFQPLLGSLLLDIMPCYGHNARMQPNGQF